MVGCLIKNLFQIVSIAIPALILTTTSLISDETALYDPSTFVSGKFVCPIDRTENITLLMELHPGDERFPVSIPRGYFDRRFSLKNYSIKQAQGLRIHGEQFEPWPRGLLPKSQVGPYIGMLLTDYIPLEELARVKADLSLGYRKTNRPEYKITDAVYGLETLMSDAPPYRVYDVFRYDLYIARNENGDIMDVITCNKPASVPYPGCQQYIETSLMDIKIRYSRGLLKHWQALSKNARTFVNCITSEPS